MVPKSRTIKSSSCSLKPWKVPYDTFCFREYVDRGLDSYKIPTDLGENWKKKPKNRTLLKWKPVCMLTRFPSNELRIHSNAIFHALSQSDIGTQKKLQELPKIEKNLTK